ncbi:MATE family efflux transporter [Desulfobacula sp.]|uniref:MATE family efflux transporter n=2 Tax=Desulfobacula sp. TaxID=2593537 RepID=UPI0039B847A5
MITGSIFRQLIKLASPIMFGMLIFTLYLMTDLWFVGRLGPDAITALSIASNVFFIHLGLSFIIGTGAMSLIAQAFGARDEIYASIVFKQSLLLCLIIGSFAAIVGFLLAQPYISFFGGSGMALKWGVEYFQIYAVSLLFLLLLHVFNACYRGMGDTKTSMYIMLQSLVLNIILDPVLIFGWAGFPTLGVKGAALASLMSQIYGVLIYVYLVFIRKQHINLKGSWILNFNIIKQSLKIGVPSGLAYFLLTANLLITYRIIGPYGIPALASFGIGFRIIQAIYLPTVAISEAAAAIVGQNYGANNSDRVIKTFWTGWKISSIIMIIGTLACWISPEFLIHIFSKDPEVTRYGIIYLKISSLANIVVGTILIVSAVFQGIGKTYPSLFGALLDNILFILIIFTLPVYFGWGISSLWWIKLITGVMEMSLCLFWLRSHFLRMTKVL